MSSDGPVDPESLTAEEWVLAIIVAYESGCGLTPEAKEELRQATQNPEVRDQIRAILIKEGYESIFGLLKSNPET
ncbi:MAG TPA: hypothetical protein VLE93_00295 [Candidatus Saccharimonadales bacterium]|nr:hypothetical protein [Candidatus Saccharimonadales bacterium]